MPQAKPIIGLAGGIGSGKSTVARYLRELGALVIDADKLARQALDRPDVGDQIVRWWGEEILDEEGRPDRRRIASRVFSEPAERKRLEGLIHPIVARKRDRMIEEAQGRPEIPAIVLDVPLLFEVGLNEKCDHVVFVKCDRATRLARLRETRGWEESELERREKNQMPLERKLQWSDHIVDNNHGEMECRRQVRHLLSQILEAHTAAEH